MEPGLRPGRSQGCPPSHNLPAMLATAWSPDEHCLLTADKGTVSGMPLKQEARESAPSLPALRESKPGLLASLTAPLWGSWGEVRQKDQGNKQAALPALQAIHTGQIHFCRCLRPRPCKHMPFHPVILLNQGQARPRGKRRLAGSRLAFEGSKVKLYNPLSPRARVSNPQSMGEYRSLAC